MNRKLSASLTLAAFALVGAVSPVSAQIESAAVVNAASFQERFPLSPGCWATVFADFASQGVSNTFAEALPFPRMLGGVEVFVNDVASPMNFAGGGQINFLVPGETPEGRVPFRVAVSGMTVFEGDIQIWPTSPGLLSINPGDAARPGAVLNQDSTLNTEANPAAPGEVIQIYGVGADFSELPADGAAAPTDRLIETSTPTLAYVSVAEAVVSFSGLAPGLVNAWQLNIVVPDESFIDGQVPVQAEVNGLKTNAVSFWVAR